MKIINHSNNMKQTKWMRIQLINMIKIIQDLKINNKIKLLKKNMINK
jgi:hypothetical protein